MESYDPATGQKLPADAIQRVLFIAGSVHVYNIPPLTSTKGYTAATWTEDPKRHIITCRLRVVETAVPQADGAEDKVKTDVVLEDPASGQLFAAAPYSAPAVVESALDSARFFAVRVQDPSGRKATLGIGFEERSEAFDFGVALQDARKALGLDGGTEAAAAQVQQQKKKDSEEKRDLSLKEGETITVNLAGKFGRRRPQQESEPSDENASLSSFSLPPPPNASGSRGGFSLAPPPSAQEVRQDQQTAKDLGFDDGQFGEFA
ncbi:Adaptin ear-binding coat-associated protein 2 [Cytospora mali]|uniref:Adaptin ear-binding coat-associated protein 2 n=1 Tax=Cytospora mali TaxID=578113 RepID=A0A194VXG7_CYTMA|nr:Adaptin ear-binding coat-associated protein 2 [Valsa mali]